MIQGLGSIRLDVAELDRSLAFYRDGLRFELVQPADGPPRHATLQAGSLLLQLCEVGAARRGRTSGIGIRVDVVALDAYRDAVATRGVRTGPGPFEDGARQFAVRDPDGYVWLFREALG